MVTILLALGAVSRCEAASSNGANVRRMTLEECIHTALAQNKALQIERLNPPLARARLSGAYGYYDPLFSSEYRSESLSDSGGLDPTDFSRDAIYTADSQTARAGFTGFLPSGLSYTLSGGYAHSDGFRNGFNFESYSMNYGILVRQPLLKNAWVDQSRMAIRVNRTQVRISESGLRFVVMDLMNRVQQAYYELSFTHGELKARQELLQSRNEFLTAVRRKIELGTLTLLDQSLAEAQVANVEVQMATVETAVALAENELRLLLGEFNTHSPPQRLEPTDLLLALPETFDLPARWDRGLAGRPDLAQLRQDVEKAATQLKYWRNQLFPALDLVASVSRRGASTSQVVPPLSPSASFDDAVQQLKDRVAPSDMVGVVLTVPLGRTTERANFRAGKLLKSQAELRVRQAEEQVLREITDSVRSAETSLERYRRTRRAHELAQTALASEEQKLAGGKSTLLAVLLLQDNVATTRSAELRAKADYNRAQSQLRFSEGSLLEQWAIDVKMD
jgi:outer membrane protein TolC